MQMALNVAMDFSEVHLKGELLRNKIRDRLTDTVRADSTPYVPKRTGDLRTSAEKKSRPAEGLIIWGGETASYARKQYYNFPHKTFPGAQMHWFEHVAKAKRTEWERTARAIAKEICDA